MTVPTYFTDLHAAFFATRSRSINTVFVTVISLLALFAVPALANEYWLQAILIPFLIFALAALGLNLLTGFAGQLSLGTGGFMAVGAYAAFKMTTAWPGMDIIAIFFISGFFAAGVGILFGLPSLRIKGFYLAVATLAAQFFLIWLFNRVPWFYNDNPSGTITAPPREFAGVMITGPQATAEVRYLVALVLLAVFVFFSWNLMRSRFGRAWMAVRDMDVAAEIVGIPLLRTKLLAFGVSSYLCGVAGALFVFLYLGSAETIAFDVNVSFLVLFMIIVGGLGSITGSIIGAAFITILPIFLTNLNPILGIDLAVDLAKHIEVIIFGGIIIAILILEPHGIARLIAISRERLRI